MPSFYTAANMNNTFWLWRDTISTAADLRVEERDLTTNTFVRNLTIPAYFNENWACNTNQGNPCQQHRGYVAYSAANATLAYGVMRRDNADAPLAFKFMNWCSGGNSTCTTGRAELVFDFFKRRSLSTTSYQTETVFLVVGPPADVRTRLRQIYCQETGACVP
jgi:hypothetical protein